MRYFECLEIYQKHVTKQISSLRRITLARRSKWTCLYKIGYPTSMAIVFFFIFYCFSKTAAWIACSNCYEQQARYFGLYEIKFYKTELQYLNFETRLFIPLEIYCFFNDMHHNIFITVAMGFEVLRTKLFSFNKLFLKSRFHSKIYICNDKLWHCP